MMLENMSNGAIDLRISLPALLVMKSARVADACQHQAMANPVRDLVIASQPSDRSDRSRDE